MKSRFNIGDRVVVRSIKEMLSNGMRKVSGGLRAPNGVFFNSDMQKRIGNEYNVVRVKKREDGTFTYLLSSTGWYWTDEMLDDADAQPIPITMSYETLMFGTSE